MSDKVKIPKEIRQWLLGAASAYAKAGAPAHAWLQDHTEDAPEKIKIPHLAWVVIREALLQYTNSSGPKDFMPDSIAFARDWLRNRTEAV